MDTEEYRVMESNQNLLYIFGVIAHSLMLLIFFQYHITIMAYFNVFSIALYIAILALIKDRPGIKYRAFAFTCSSIEVIVHQILAIICVGTGIGFQYFLILIGLTVILQSKTFFKKNVKILLCVIVVLITISVEIYATTHKPIYHLPIGIQIILLVLVTMVSVFGVFSFSLNQWNLSEHYRDRIETLLGERNTKILEMQEKTIHNFADIVERRDGNTGGHIKRTSAYVEAIIDALIEGGKYKKTLTPEYVKMVISAAPSHDLGKIAISDTILCKKGRLTEEEYEIMKTHSVIGGNMIKELLGDMESEEYVSLATDVARSHHEKWNGRGYPDQLRGWNIPLSARIMAVADVFDALTSVRAYKDKFSLDKAYEIMESEAGQQFDAAIIEEFVRIRPRISEIYNTLSED